jgi:4-amino-4-deoxy-L-arabinose transferase-like glycosyltransferase
VSEASAISSGYLSRLARYPVPVLIVLCLFAWLPGLFCLPPLDRDESRFAQASKQMIETGDYIDIRFSTVPRYNKPVGIYWAQAAASRALGHPPYNQIWTYRLPSLAGGLLAVLLTYWCARAFTSRETALIGAVLLGLSVLLAGEAQIATTDALLLATIVAAQGVFLRVYLFHRDAIATRPSLWMTSLGWAAIGAGILLKGPVILAVVAVTGIVLSLWERDWRWLRAVHPVRGILVMLAIVLPWAVAIAFTTHGAFYQRSLGHDFAAKVMAGQETHGAPPGYYLVLAAVTFWPATLFALPAIGAAILKRTEPAVRYLLAWMVPNWILFEGIPTKLPHYILPVYPALALLVALWIMREPSAPQTRWMRRLQVVSMILLIVVALAAALAIVIVPERFGSGFSLPANIGAAMLLGLALYAVVLQWRDRAAQAMLCAAAAALLLYPLLTSAVAPQLKRLWLSRTLAEHLVTDRKSGDPPVILSGYLEPSLVFLLGTDTLLESGAKAGVLAARQGGIALIGDRERGLFLSAIQKNGAKATPVDQVTGFDYSRGRDAHIIFFRVTPAASAKPAAQ